MNMPCLILWTKTVHDMQTGVVRQKKQSLDLNLEASSTSSIPFTRILSPCRWSTDCRAWSGTWDLYVQAIFRLSCNLPLVTLLSHARGHGKRHFIHVVTYLSARLRHSKCITVPGGVGVVVGPTVTHTHNTLQNKHILIACFQNIKRRIYQALHRIMLSQVYER